MQQIFENSYIFRLYLKRHLTQRHMWFISLLLMTMTYRLSAIVASY